jgi:glycogen synthase
MKGDNPDMLQGRDRGEKSEARMTWIISYTPVSKEPRVIRQIQALEQEGWQVVVFGLKGKTQCPETWNFVELPIHDTFFRGRIGFAFTLLAAKIVGIVRLLAMLLGRYGCNATQKELGGRLHQALLPPYWLKKRVIRNFAHKNECKRPDLVISHDYFTSDIGLEMARKANAKLIVDCHEYALGQYAHDPRWAHWHRPHIKALQDYVFTRADAVTTVCPGIAGLIQADHGLAKPVRVIRSVPFYECHPYRPVGPLITVLYHGEIYPSRGLHVAVRSMRWWRPEFRLVLRGYSDPAYVLHLRDLAAEHGVRNRLFIEEPVPFNEIIPTANLADVGYFVHQDVSPQRRFVLPNKFFEYIMAGLALVVSDLPEMAGLVRHFECGSLVPDFNEESIASTINALDAESINTMKKRSLEAAKKLNWEKEKESMMTLYRKILQ